ncbi:TetR/AcrR family transcriptional regulator [Planktosalinus lacus]|uniref:TetR family transcriptional regulator n=1 Tax=Planktosalinus lacus TaxID=1526573 RepID=A0A8J2V791_9FLAO|nr:TetR/AcrR family transcriptional regulator [Planktosalinus lacus]GGD82473.1 TetR family transcriptional regulator [Planktosalinus lacus]
MREKILEIASELFLNLGFKSVTMDDIANEMGISKKTIYQHFENKTKLVEATTDYVFHFVCEGIDCIRAENNNPIAELFQINTFIKQMLKNEKASPQHQLQKYYPEIYKKLDENKFLNIHECVISNLRKGIEMGLYRESIKPEIIGRFYFLGATGIKNQDLFPLDNYTPNELMELFLEYHLRGIVTSKGEKELIKHINQN